MIHFGVGEPVPSADDFPKLVSWLPTMLDPLLNSEPYDDVNRPPRGEHGIYLFSESDVHLYVGRTGITARARAGVTESGTSFRARFDNTPRMALRRARRPLRIGSCARRQRRSGSGSRRDD